MVKKSMEFSIDYMQILDENGNCDGSLMPQLSEAEIKKMYELMILARTFDEYALKLQREGRILTFASAKGQEACQIGSVLAMQEKDWIFPAFRENAAFIARGFPMEMLYQYWGGDERGMKIPEKFNFFTIAIPVASQIPHAVGFAWGAKLKGDNIAVVVYFGDGATSEGEFHEALNFAGVFHLPVVFICQNNQWAISMPRSRQSAAQTLAQKAIAYGFNGIQVDGNDVFAVYRSTKEALEKARKGEPTLIECFTYRLSDHTTADDAKRYRTQEELEAWMKKDPIDRLRKYMASKGIWNEDYEKKVRSEAIAKVEEAVKKAEAIQPASREDVFKYMFAEMPQQLKDEMSEL